MEMFLHCWDTKTENITIEMDGRRGGGNVEGGVYMVNYSR